MQSSVAPLSYFVAEISKRRLAGLKFANEAENGDARSKGSRQSIRAVHSHLVNTVRVRNDAESRTFNIRLLQRGRVGFYFWHANHGRRRLLECFP